VALVKTNVEKIYLEVSELKNEALDEERVVVIVLSLVVFVVGRPLGHLAELQVHDCGYNSLSDCSYQIHIALRVKDSAWIRHVR